MSQVINKQNIAVVVEEYKCKQTGNLKKKHRTIGELVTMQGDDGSTFQFGKLWGAGGVTEIKIFDQEERQNALQAAGVQQAPQAAPQPMGTPSGQPNYRQPAQQPPAPNEYGGNADLDQKIPF